MKDLLDSVKQIFPDKDLSHLDILMNNGRLNPMTSAWFVQQKHANLQAFAVKNGLYHFVTLELLDFLFNEIKGRNAIEICCGNDNIGYNLGIPMTDSFIQHKPEVRLVYELMDQAITQPPPETYKMDASAALKAFSPQVVIGAFVSQKYDQINSPINPGAVYGVNEIEILQECETYISLGNKDTHAQKKIFQITHQELCLPFLFNRSFCPELNRIWIWNRDRYTTEDKKLLFKLNQ